MKRIIMHYDMDAFFASVEINRNPKLKDKALVVGENIVTTASYEARKYGIHSAMKVSDAKILCPKLIVIPVDKKEYQRVSNQIHELVYKITNKAEFISLDEGYIDLTNIITEDKKIYFAETFRKRIKEITNLTCSVGIGFNKLSAKIASDINKPFGQFIFNNEEEFINYISDKKVKIIPGVGKKFNETLKKDGIFLVKDVFKYTLDYLVKKYGKSRGENLYCSIRGIDYSDIEFQKGIHSIGNEETFMIPLMGTLDLTREINSLFEFTYNRLDKKKVFTKSITIKIRYTNFETITRSKKLKIATKEKEYLYNIVLELFNLLEKDNNIRLIGIYFGDIQKNNIVQLQLT
ncbi:DNA polymerase IV [Fusobacterium gastrosuis]|uniref:DNA polymerase IV n=1 Tax=Fusobacterium gastrosuis TaxID=1755100 RepID=UPI002973559D|nr:DNA polymerase IV [Fusobacteriaceae bacterium]MDY5713916.1 DNA polymerase IV [Fusobacterium gastrosuis]